MTPSTPSPRRSTRLLATPSVLGKRSFREAQSSEPMSTPKAMPNPKRKRLAKIMEEGNNNMGNVPPSPSTDGETETRTNARPTEREVIHQPSSPSQAIATPQARSSWIEIPQTPATSTDHLYLNTPLPTPTATCSLHARIRSLFRVTSDSSQCMSLNGREKEQQIIGSFLRCIDSDSPEIVQPVLYISGSPGSGKSALVDSIFASTPMSSNTRVITMNCMAFNNVDTVWEYLGEELYGPIRKGGRKTKKVYNKDTMTKMLETEKSLKCIAILDEIDHLSSFNSLQSLIHLAVRLPQTLRLIGIANTHTLSSTSTLLPFALESSAEHINTIHFAPYTSAQLLSILQKRLESIPQDELKRMLPVSTLILLTKKVAAVTGDVRVLFQVLRGAIDNAVSSTAMEGRGRTSGKCTVVVTPAHILTALKPHTSATSTTSPTKSSISETVTKVGKLGLHNRLVLLSLLVASKRLARNLSLSLSGSSALPSPTKGSPTKCSQSTSSTASASNKPIAPPPTQSIDASKLHSLYTAILDSADMFKPLTRSEFSDSLGLLESSGLLSLSAGSGSGNRTSKRASSFTVKMRGGGVAGGAAQCVRLQSGIREKEVARGLGIVIVVDAAEAATPSRVENSKVDVREEDVRTIWNREMVRIRKAVKAKDFAIGEANREIELGFEDAMED